MPGIRAIVSALAVAACAVALAACGDDDDGTIPEEAGRGLLGQLDQIETLVGQGECEAARDASVEFADGVDELPDEVGGELRARLVEAAEQLESLTESPDQCTPITGPSGFSGELPEDTVLEEPDPTESTEPESTEEPAPEEDDEGGGPTEGSDDRPGDRERPENQGNGNPGNGGEGDQGGGIGAGG